MNVINVSLKPDTKTAPALFLDGKAARLKKSKGGGLFCTYETENDAAELCLCTLNEAASRWFWLTAVFFFIISCFGIFDARYEKTCRAVRYKCVLHLNGTVDVALKSYTQAVGFRSVECACSCPFEETENVCFTDEKAKKRLKRFKTIKILLWSGLIVLTGAICALIILL